MWPTGKWYLLVTPAAHAPLQVEARHQEQAKLEVRLKAALRAAKKGGSRQDGAALGQLQAEEAQLRWVGAGHLQGLGMLLHAWFGDVRPGSARAARFFMEVAYGWG